MQVPKFVIKRKEKEWTLDDEIHAITNELVKVKFEDEDEYKRLLEYLERLTDVKQKQKLVIHPDTLVGAAATFLGILVIMGYERGHVIATKAFSLLPKIRL